MAFFFFYRSSPGFSRRNFRSTPLAGFTATAGVPQDIPAAQNLRAAEAHTTADTARRYALYQRCEQILAEECPLAPIYFYTRTNLVRSEV